MTGTLRVLPSDRRDRVTVPPQYGCRKDGGNILTAKRSSALTDWLVQVTLQLRTWFRLLLSPLWRWPLSFRLSSAFVPPSPLRQSGRALQTLWSEDFILKFDQALSAREGKTHPFTPLPPSLKISFCFSSRTQLGSQTPSLRRASMLCNSSPQIGLV